MMNYLAIIRSLLAFFALAPKPSNSQQSLLDIVPFYTAQSLENL
jgi:hypothetical protein